LKKRKIVEKEKKEKKDTVYEREKKEYQNQIVLKSNTLKKKEKKICKKKFPTPINLNPISRIYLKRKK